MKNFRIVLAGCLLLIACGDNKSLSLAADAQAVDAQAVDALIVDAFTDPFGTIPSSFTRNILIEMIVGTWERLGA